MCVQIDWLTQDNQMRTEMIQTDNCQLLITTFFFGLYAALLLLEEVLNGRLLMLLYKESSFIGITFSVFFV